MMLNDSGMPATPIPKRQPVQLPEPNAPSHFFRYYKLAPGERVVNIGPPAFSRFLSRGRQRIVVAGGRK